MIYGLNSELALLFRNSGLSKPRVDEGAWRIACRHQRIVSCNMMGMMVMMMVMMMKMIANIHRRLERNLIEEIPPFAFRGAPSLRRMWALLSSSEHCCHYQSIAVTIRALLSSSFLLMTSSSLSPSSLPLSYSSFPYWLPNLSSL